MDSILEAIKFGFCVGLGILLIQFSIYYLSK
jgi:hypothetical protein